MKENTTEDAVFPERVTLFVTGDRSAFARIYHAHFSELYRYAHGTISDKEECEEIIQDIFVSLWRRRESLPPLTSLRAYLFSMVRYKIVDYLRRNNVRRRFEEHYRLFESVYDTAPEESTADELLVLMEKKIEELPSRCRQAIRLRLEDLSYKDIAVRMNISVSTVEKQIVRAMEHLRTLKTEIRNGIVIGAVSAYLLNL